MCGAAPSHLSLSARQAQAQAARRGVAGHAQVDFVVGGEDEGVALLQFFEEVHVQAQEVRQAGRWKLVGDPSRSPSCAPPTPY